MKPGPLLEQNIAAANSRTTTAKGTFADRASSARNTAWPKKPRSTAGRRPQRSTTSEPTATIATSPTHETAAEPTSDAAGELPVMPATIVGV